MRVLASAMRLDAPLIVENGGGVWLPPSWRDRLPAEAVAVDDGWLVVLGAHADDCAPRCSGWPSAQVPRLRGFGDMEVARWRAHRPPARHGRAGRTREFSEPFVAEDDVACVTLDAAARHHGLQVTRGGRFFHLIGPSDKGRAVRVVSGWLGARIVGTTLGFGDAPNDLPLLQAVDTPSSSHARTARPTRISSRPCPTRGSLRRLGRGVGTPRRSSGCRGTRRPRRGVSAASRRDTAYLTCCPVSFVPSFLRSLVPWFLGSLVDFSSVTSSPLLTSSAANGCPRRAAAHSTA